MIEGETTKSSDKKNNRTKQHRSKSPGVLSEQRTPRRSKSLDMELFPSNTSTLSLEADSDGNPRPSGRSHMKSSENETDGNTGILKPRSMIVKRTTLSTAATAAPQAEDETPPPIKPRKEPPTTKTGVNRRPDDKTVRKSKAKSSKKSVLSSTKSK